MKEQHKTFKTRFGEYLVFYWFEQKLEDHMRFICDDTFGLMKNAGCKQYDSIIVIEHIKPLSKTFFRKFKNELREQVFEETKRALKAFSIFHDGKPIVMQVYPDKDLDSEISCDINIDGIDKDTYRITSSGQIYFKNWFEDEHPLEQILTSKGYCVQLRKEDGSEIWFNVASIFNQVFKPELLDTEIERYFDTEIERLAKQYNELGFLDLQEYSLFEYSHALIYGNEVGHAIYNRALEVTAKDREIINKGRIVENQTWEGDSNECSNDNRSKED